MYKFLITQSDYEFYILFGWCSACRRAVLLDDNVKLLENSSNYTPPRLPNIRATTRRICTLEFDATSRENWFERLPQGVEISWTQPVTNIP